MALQTLIVVFTGIVGYQFLGMLRDGDSGTRPISHPSPRYTTNPASPGSPREKRRAAAASDRAPSAIGTDVSPATRAEDGSNGLVSVPSQSPDDSTSSSGSSLTVPSTPSDYSPIHRTQSTMPKSQVGHQSLVCLSDESTGLDIQKRALEFLEQDTASVQPDSSTSSSNQSGQSSPESPKPPSWKDNRSSKAIGAAVLPQQSVLRSPNGLPSESLGSGDARISPVDIQGISGFPTAEHGDSAQAASSSTVGHQRSFTAANGSTGPDVEDEEGNQTQNEGTLARELTTVSQSIAKTENGVGSGCSEDSKGKGKEDGSLNNPSIEAEKEAKDKLDQHNAKHSATGGDSTGSFTNSAATAANLSLASNSGSCTPSNPSKPPLVPAPPAPTPDLCGSGEATDSANRTSMSATSAFPPLLGTSSAPLANSLSHSPSLSSTGSSSALSSSTPPHSSPQSSAMVWGSGRNRQSTPNSADQKPSSIIPPEAPSPSISSVPENNLQHTRSEPSDGFAASTAADYIIPKGCSSLQTDDNEGLAPTDEDTSDGGSDDKSLASSSAAGPGENGQEAQSACKKAELEMKELQSEVADAFDNAHNDGLVLADGEISVAELTNGKAWKRIEFAIETLRKRDPAVLEVKVFLTSADILKNNGRKALMKTLTKNGIRYEPVGDGSALTLSYSPN